MTTRKSIERLALRAVLVALLGSLLASAELDCGDHGHAHDDHCHCDEGYVAVKVDPEALEAASADTGHLETCVEAPHGHGDGTHLAGNRLYLDLPVEELAGAWVGFGDQVHQAPWDAWQNGGYPNCSAYEDDGRQWNFEHYHALDPHFKIITQVNGSWTFLYLGHRDVKHSFTMTNVTNNVWSGPSVEVDSNATKCHHFEAFVDLTSGELFEQTLWQYSWYTNDEGKVEYKDTSCELKGTEKPGCYSSGSLEDGDLVVRSVGLATSICKNGACAKHSPVLNPTWVQF